MHRHTHARLPFLVAAFILFTLASFGQNIPKGPLKDIKIKDIRGDSLIRLSQYKNAKGLVFIYASTGCPYSDYYQSRIADLHKEFGPKGFQFILVNADNAHRNPGDHEDSLKTKKSFIHPKFPLVKDKNQELTDLLEARKNMQVIVAMNIGGRFQVKYSGGIDDNPQLPSDVQENYLKDFLTRANENPKLPAETSPTVGCLIRKF
jgi:thiol-disulfide isomerase/thioredoxin